MKTLIGLFAVLSVLVFGIGSNTASAEDTTDIDLMFGINICPDYNDLLDDAYPDAEISGGYGWLDLGIGLRWKAGDSLSVTPALGLLVNFVVGDESFMNSIILPRIIGRYQFGATPSFYVGAEANYNIPNSGSDRFDFESGGIGFGGVMGYRFEGDWNLEAGYLHIPVDVTPEGMSGTVREENMGGVLVRFGKTF